MPCVMRPAILPECLARPKVTDLGSVHETQKKQTLRIELMSLCSKETLHSIISIYSQYI
jgi:hypothetical protein